MLFLLPLCYMPYNHPSEQPFFKIKYFNITWVNHYSVCECFLFRSEDVFWFFDYLDVVSFRPRSKTNKTKQQWKTGSFFSCFSSTYNHCQEHSTLPAIASASHVRNLTSPQPSPLSSFYCSPELAADVYSAQIPIHRGNCCRCLLCTNPCT